MEIWHAEARGLCPRAGGAWRWELLTDLQGLEDAAGDMDLKLAGSRAGITAAQLDVKGGGAHTPSPSQFRTK